MNGLEAVLQEIAVQELRTAARYRGFARIPQELAAFRADPVWSHFGFDSEEFLRLRYIGNYYTSIFRKMGDMYERFVRAIVMDRLGLTEEDIDFSFDVNIDGRAQSRSLDLAIPTDRIRDQRVARRVYGELVRIGGREVSRTAVIEVRCCYQIGDSKRIQADETAAMSARQAGLLPLLMIFCTTSLRSPVQRLRRTWYVTEGMESYNLLERLTGFDLNESLSRMRPVLKREVRGVLRVFNG